MFCTSYLLKPPILKGFFPRHIRAYTLNKYWKAKHEWQKNKLKQKGNAYLFVCGATKTPFLEVAFVNVSAEAIRSSVFYILDLVEPLCQFNHSNKCLSPQSTLTGHSLEGG